MACWRPCATDGETPYVTAASYHAHGAPASLEYGNGLYEQRGYNRRLQAADVRLGSTLGDQDYLGNQ